MRMIMYSPSLVMVLNTANDGGGGGGGGDDKEEEDVIITANDNISYHIAATLKRRKILTVFMRLLHDIITSIYFRPYTFARARAGLAHRLLPRRPVPPPRRRRAARSRAAPQCAAHPER